MCCATELSTQMGGSTVCTLHTMCTHRVQDCDCRDPYVGNGKILDCFDYFVATHSAYYLDWSSIEKWLRP